MFFELIGPLLEQKKSITFSVEVRERLEHHQGGGQTDPVQVFSGQPTEMVPR